MTKTHKNAADTFIRISSCISQMGTSEYMDIDRFLNKVLSKVNLLTVHNLTVLSVRLEVGVSLLLAPARAN